MPADPRALAVALDLLGVACEVEAQGGLAILVPRAAGVPGAQLRLEIVRAARAAGFANVAFDLVESPPAGERAP